jgi:nicotinamidase-related amidase
METHICVAHTALGLRAAGHDVWVIPDACVSRRKEDWETGLSWMASEGVRVVPCESVLFGLVGSAGGPIFKEISRRIR